MRYRCFEHAWVLRLDKGEELVTALNGFCREQGIRLALVSGIGALQQATIGCFKVATKEYVRKELVGDYEITALTGTITSKDGVPYLHLHITVADSDGHAFGGHLDRAIVSGTCEIVLLRMQGEIQRSFNDAVGLNLMDL